MVFPAAPPAETANGVPNCLLSLDEEAQVPAQEAGVLMKIPVREGRRWPAGDLLAQIDDVVPQAEDNVAKYKLKVAKKQATDDINVRYSSAAADVADAKLEQGGATPTGKSPAPFRRWRVDEQRLE